MKLIVRAFLLVLPLPSALVGQTPTDTVALNPVVVTATRVATPASDVPVAVTVLRGADLAARGIRTVLEALREVPGAAVAQTGSFGGQASLFLRGGQSNYVKVLVDGVPQNVPGGAYDFANLTTDNVERIEVVRGPVSVLYGSDAVAGVVQIFTRDGTGPRQASLAASGGTYGSAALDATLAGGDERASYAFSVSRFTSDGIDSINNQLRNEVVSGRARVRPDPRTEAAVSLRYGDALYHFPRDYRGIVASNNQHQLERGPTLGIDLGHDFSDRVEGRLTAGWHRANYQYAIAPNGPSDSTTFPFSSSDWITRLDLDARTNVRLATGDVLTVGGALEREAMSGTTLDTSRSRNTGAIYLQALMNPERTLHLTIGARLEDNERFGTYATYRGGLSVGLGARVRAVASVGTGFKEPSFYENFATGFVRGNPDLRPEHSQSWEAGLEYLAPGRAVVRATYFGQRFVDMIDYDPNAGAGQPNYSNVARASADGVEVGARLTPQHRVSLGATYTYLSATVTRSGFDPASGALLAAGEPLVRRPKHSAAVDFTYGIARRGTAALAVVYVGERQDRDFSIPSSPRVPLPSYVRMDCTTELDVLPARGGAPGLAFSGRIENLLDHPYEEVKNFPARRRTIFLGGELRFGAP
jgi:vitamin B12 transporter